MLESAYNNVIDLCSNKSKFIYLAYDYSIMEERYCNIEAYCQVNKSEYPPSRLIINLDSKRNYLEELVKWKSEHKHHEGEHDVIIWFQDSDVALFDYEQLRELVRALYLLENIYISLYIQVNTMSAGKKLSKILNLDFYKITDSCIERITSAFNIHTLFNYQVESSFIKNKRDGDSIESFFDDMGVSLEAWSEA